jgi:5'-3' exonuclease
MNVLYLNEKENRLELTRKLNKVNRKKVLELIDLTILCGDLTNYILI